VTGVVLEPQFWNQLRLIAFERHYTIKALISEINRKGRLLPFQGLKYRRVLSLSAAIRLFVLQDVLAKLEMAREHATRLDKEVRRLNRHSPDRAQSLGLPAWRPATAARWRRT
jgi:predicted DNA-binding ribbon-helix-helix protein